MCHSLGNSLSLIADRLTSRGAQFNDGSLYLTYRNVSGLGSPFHTILTWIFQQVILSVIGIPGAFLAGWSVELPYIGRKGTLGISSGKWPVIP
jgi:hypothetical protein